MKKTKLLTALMMTLIMSVLSCTDLHEEESQELEITLGNPSANGNDKTGKSNAIITNPDGGTFNVGTIMNIRWDFILCCDWSSNYLHIDLYKSNTFVFRIAADVPFLTLPRLSYAIGEYIWEVPGTLASFGSDYQIRITSTSNSNNTTISDYFTIPTPDPSICHYSYWTLTGAPNYLIANNTTVNYQINESGIVTLAHSNSPTMSIYSYEPINVIYNGTTYYCSSSGVTIPINGSPDCSQNNPVITAPLKFQQISSSLTTVIVSIHSVSSGHLFYHGYHSFYLN